MNATLRNAALAAVTAVTSIAASAIAQDAVQWRVEDGGNGHWYAVRNDGGTWLQAKASAELTGGHLATVANAPENAFLWGILGASTFYPCFAFLGGYQDSAAAGFVEPGGGWRWVTGEPFEFSAWFSGEPNDGGGCGCENYLSFRQFDCNARWNDTGSNAAPNHTYIIEWSADCNNDGVVDYGQIRSGELVDANANNIPDCCEQGSCAALEFGLEAHYLFEGNCLDATVNARHGVPAGISYTPGPSSAFGQCASFDGTTSDIRIQGIPIPTNNAFSWALWVKSNAVGQIPLVERIQAVGVNLLSPSLFIRPLGRLGFGSYLIPKGGSTVETAPDSLLPNQWTHIACTSSTSGVRKVYVDGVLIGEGTSPSYGEALGMMLIGRDRIDCCTRFAGQMDDLRVYSRPLLPNEVVALFESVTQCSGDVSGNGVVDGVDLAAVLGTWGSNGKGEFLTDIDGDGTVGGTDLAVVLNSWGACP